jgi:hypothetical protein
MSLSVFAQDADIIISLKKEPVTVVILRRQTLRLI